ncbi:OstA-like protein [Anseongella ginsenosidimutans]|uniref:OstA-like protein n=1 Tax=Anseongella ginsenosidimutans TaxID=496056 RepID=UPI0013153DF8|nr:OstA-like protein [Anseongella ginsenosidimutans]
MKLRLFIVILCCCFAALLKAQDTTTTIRVLDSDYLVAEEDRSWIINGTFEHEDATMQCDSTFFNQQNNTLEAYGDVFIRQDDTITVRADRLFYDGTTRMARFYENITLSDGQAVLTTNFLTYDLVTREGTYNNGGQIVNQRDTLNSRKGYYFVGSKDAYFRENAIVNTPDALIKSDTLRYNTGTKTAYFYGPTTIEGEDDFIYAENGTYNTGTDQAHFQENAYYRSGSHLLRGNELYYDRKQNFGRAIEDVFIIDTIENIILRGELGEYNKATETAFVTDSAQVIMIAEQDSARNDTIYMAADTLMTRLLPVPLIKEWIAASYERDVLGKDIPVPEMLRTAPGIPSAGDSTQFLSGDSTLLEAPGLPDAADSLGRRLNGRDSLVSDSARIALSAEGVIPSNDPARQDSLPARDALQDSLPARDRLVQPGNPARQEDTIPRQDSLPQQDSLLTEAEVAANAAKPSPRFIGPPPLKPSDYLPRAVADSLSRALAAADSLKNLPADSVVLPVDSARVLFAFNRVRVFKSDLQAISDSLVYTSVDSVMRVYKTPVVWSEGSQMSSEFMTITMRHKKVDRLNMYRSAMIISEAETDSSRYNQMSGKEMTGFFTEGALTRLVVEGNARTIYYVPEDSVGTLGINYAENSRTILYFKDNELEVVELLKDAEQITYPEGDPEAITRLEGFHWRQNERPRDKNDIFRIVEPSPPPPAPEEKAPKALQAGSSGTRSSGTTVSPVPPSSVPPSSVPPSSVPPSQAQPDEE